MFVIYEKTGWGSGVYSEITFGLRIRRTGITILATIILPGVIVSFLALMYIFMPKGSGQRIPYMNGLLLNEIMFLVMMT